MTQNLHVPDFVCIGAQKAGTTWLYEQLRQQEGICIPEKECNILLRENPATLYSNFYENRKRGDLLGDVSPAYSTSDTGKKLFALNPKAKIIFLLRDPVDRAFSQYCMATEAERIPKDISFSNAFNKDLSFIKRRGDYPALIDEHIRAGFSIDQILFLDFRELSIAPGLWLDKVANFLGLQIELATDIAETKFAEATKRNVMASADRDAVKGYYEKRFVGFEEYAPWTRRWWE